MDIHQRYQDALDFIFSFVDNSRTHAQNLQPEHYKLDRMRSFMALFGNPQDTYPSIHVAGTKGKGSVSALCASALQAAGYKVGLNTSPHLQEFTERIKINNIEISPKRLVKLVDEIKPHVLKTPDLTTFEIITALAMLHFAKEKVDIAVFEVGLGGRLDATNIITPIVGVITSISLDHTEILGNTLEEIAQEKAGIIKKEIPVVISKQDESARKKIAQIAFHQSAPLIEIGENFHYLPTSHTLDGQYIWLWNSSEDKKMQDFLDGISKNNWAPLEIHSPLLGSHQAENIAAAFAALDIVNRSGFPIPISAIQDGFANVKWPGRFEILNQHPLIVIDAAHNPDSADKLRQTLDDYFPGQPTVVIFGVSSGKSISEMLNVLKPRITKLITTQSIHPRAVSGDMILVEAQKTGLSAISFANMEEALPFALTECPPNGLVVITGSIFIAAAARQVWQTVGKPFAKNKI